MATIRSNLDPLLDKPWLDFLDHLDEIKKGNVQLIQSPLFKFLTPHIQEEILQARVDDAIELIKKAYNFQDVIPFWKNIDLDTSPIDVNVEFEKCRQKLNFLKNREFDDYNECILNDGVSDSLGLIMTLTFKRFHHEFGMDDFLVSMTNVQYPEHYQTLVTRDKPISRQMMASRMNFILHGFYLAIIINLSERDHATCCLFIPVVSSQYDGSHVTWHLIDVNSNGEYPTRGRNRFKALSTCSKEYSQWLGNNQVQIKTTYQESFCVKNIQKEYGTCAYWSKILAFQFFIDYSRFQDVDSGSLLSTLSLLTEEEEKTIDNGWRFLHELDVTKDRIEKKSKISIFCGDLEKRTRMFLIINRFNNYIVDLATSFMQLYVDHVQYLREKGISPIQDDICKDILHGSYISHTIILDLAIFKRVDQIRAQLRKYYDKPPQSRKNRSDFADLDNEFETDDETPEEQQRLLDIRECKERKNQEIQRKIEQQRQIEEAKKIERKKTENKEALERILLTIIEIDRKRPHLFIQIPYKLNIDERSRFVRLVDDFIKLRSEEQDIHVKLGRFIAGVCLKKKNEEEQYYEEKIDKLQKDLDERNEELETWTKMVEADPDAPPVRIWPKYMKRFLRDDIEILRESKEENESEITKLKEQVDVLKSTPINFLVEDILTLIEKSKNPEREKRPRELDE